MIQRKWPMYDHVSTSQTGRSSSLTTRPAGTKFILCFVQVFGYHYMQSRLVTVSSSWKEIAVPKIHAKGR